MKTPTFIFLLLGILGISTMSFLKTDHHPDEIPNKLAKDLTKYIGAKISSENIQILDMDQVYSWSGIPELLLVGDSLNAKYKKFVYFKFDKKVNGLFRLTFEAPRYFKVKYNIDFVVGISEEKYPKYRPMSFATVRSCSPAGICKETIVFYAGNPPENSCTSDEDCEGNTINCIYKHCAFDQCIIQYIKSTNWGCPPDEGSCENTGVCGQGAKDTICSTRKCEGDECITIQFDLPPGSTNCPPPECDKDKNCKKSDPDILRQPLLEMIEI